MLYLVATPIGNLGDITFRAIETLKICDYILCEDTRHSLPLLSHYDIKKPLKSYHKFNEVESQQAILEDLQSGKKIALISDAGTPGICDPGALLVQRCVEQGYPVISIPGPCAAISALTTSGFNTEKFQFVGFLPKKNTELKNCLLDILNYPGTTISYESPERLLDTLSLIHELASDRQVAVARELTKKFEEIQRGTPKQLIDYWNAHTLKGEIVLLFSPSSHSPHSEWLNLSPEAHVAYLETTYHLSRKEAIKMAAEQRDVPKRLLYNELLKNKETQE